MDVFSRLLVKDYRTLGGITKHARDVVLELGHQDVFLEFGGVNLRGRLDIDLCLGGL